MADGRHFEDRPYTIYTSYACYDTI